MNLILFALGAFRRGAALCAALWAFKAGGVVDLAGESCDDRLEEREGAFSMSKEAPISSSDSRKLDGPTEV